MKIHMQQSRKRRTVCGINYDNTIMHKFIPNQLAGHWSRVNCKKCLKLKERYTKFMKTTLSNNLNDFKLIRLNKQEKNKNDFKII